MQAGGGFCETPLPLSNLRARSEIISDQPKVSNQKRGVSQREDDTHIEGDA